MNRIWFRALTANALLCCALIAQSHEALFSPAPGSPLDVGQGSGFLVLTDVNRDGNPDLIAQHLLQRMITVQLGDGKGRFSNSPGSPIKLSYSPGNIKVADLNGDGFEDLAVSKTEEDTVDIFAGDGNGRFSLAPGSPVTASSSTESNTHGLQLIDIDEDGKRDIMTFSNQRNALSVLIGDGRGRFTPGKQITFPPGKGRYRFVFGDVDGDKHMDIGVINSGDDFDERSNLVILRGDGKGAFKTSSPIPVTSGAQFAALGDMNGDNRPDIVFTHRSNQVTILLNQAGGTFERGPTHTLNTDAFGFAVIDVNQDRMNDLLVATVDSLTVVLNTKSGLVTAPGPAFRAGPGAYYAALGDVNRDGKADIAVSSFEGKGVTILLAR